MADNKTAELVRSLSSFIDNQAIRVGGFAGALSGNAEFGIASGLITKAITGTLDKTADGLDKISDGIESLKTIFQEGVEEGQKTDDDILDKLEHQNTSFDGFNSNQKDSNTILGEIRDNTDEFVRITRDASVKQSREELDRLERQRESLFDVSKPEDNSGSGSKTQPGEDNSFLFLGGGLLAGLLSGLKISAIGAAIGNAIFSGITAYFEDGKGVSTVANVIGKIFGGTGQGLINSFIGAGTLGILGATIGSAAGPIGTIAGGIIGVILGGIAGFLGGDYIAKKVDDTLLATGDLVVDSFTVVMNFFELAYANIKDLIDDTVGWMESKIEKARMFLNEQFGKESSFGFGLDTLMAGTKRVIQLQDPRDAVNDVVQDRLTEKNEKVILRNIQKKVFNREELTEKEVNLKKKLEVKYPKQNFERQEIGILKAGKRTNVDDVLERQKASEEIKSQDRRQRTIRKQTQRKKAELGNLKLDSSGSIPINFEQYKNTIGQRESRGNYKAVNKLGFVGKYQFGLPALVDIGLVKREYSKAGNRALNNPQVWNGGLDLEKFLNSPNIQEEAMKAYTKMNFERLKGLDVVSSDSSQSQIAGALAAAHLKGPGGAARLINEGRDNSDAFGTKASEYFQLGTMSQNGVPAPNVPTSPENNNIQVAHSKSTGNLMGNFISKLGEFKDLNSISSMVVNNNSSINGGLGNSNHSTSIGPSGTSTQMPSFMARLLE